MFFADDFTGEYSFYREFRGHEIMFHVCTMLPFRKKDEQHIDRKRHIGNDVVAIVFKDSSDPADAFDPSMFKSHFICKLLLLTLFYIYFLSNL